jgi:dTDP-D-glucose 4,6-dehydratase
VCSNVREAALFRNFVLVRGDQASSDLLLHILRTHRIDTVINLAAQTHVDASFQ